MHHVRPEIVHLDPAFEPLVPMFMARRQADLAAIDAALLRGDFGALRAIAHQIKGVGGSYGFDQVSEIGVAMESAAVEGDAAVVRRELTRLSDYLACVEIVYDG
jgi:HPt (histidine-containing phosphotransfer) domain-containing protein